MIKDKIRHIKLYRDQIKFIREINFKGNYYFKSGYLIIEHILNCHNNQLTELPDNLVIKGYLYCNNNQLTRLPDNLVVKGDLGCRNNQLTRLPT